MAEAPARRGVDAPLVDKILQQGKEAFDPSVSIETRKTNLKGLLALLEDTKTKSLMPVLNLLIQPGRVFPELHAVLVTTLARLPLQPRGVQNTIEFILSVHPSTSNAQSGGGRGANISHEALNACSRLLSSPPKKMSAEAWFTGIAPQLFSLLHGDGEPGMEKAAAYIIGFGILGRRQFGAPDMPGWNAFVQPLLESIDPSLASKTKTGSQLGAANEVETISSHRILVTSAELARNLKILSTLITSHPHPSLSIRLLRPIFLPLWFLSSLQDPSTAVAEAYQKPAKMLLKTLLQLCSATEESAPKGIKDNLISLILHNLTSKGKALSTQESWIYVLSADGVQIEKESLRDDGVDLLAIDGKVNDFMDLLDSTPDLADDISKIFMSSCHHWFAGNTKAKTLSVFTRPQNQESLDDVHGRLIEAKLIQQMITQCPTKLVGDTRQVLDLVNQVLSDFLVADNGKEDEVEVSLSLLQIVITAPNFIPQKDVEEVLDSILLNLTILGKMTHLEASKTAKNLELFLTYQSSIVPEPETTSTPTSKQSEDRKTYNLAMSYLTAIDSPPPVRAQGLELLTTLIQKNSSILDIPALLVLLTSLLHDSEEFIYLRAIKSLTQLSTHHPKAVLQDLIDCYVDPTESSSLDQRLRLGEALHQVIKVVPGALTSTLGTSVLEGLLFLSSRRSRRPKTLIQQEKAAAVKKEQNAEADSAWGGSVPQLDEVLEISPEELSKQEQEDLFIHQIVTGWESKRGMEDIRIRASALSILGEALSANMEGVGTRLLSAAVDLCLHLLMLETEAEKGVLRRAAMLLILGFVDSMSGADGKKLKFAYEEKTFGDIEKVVGWAKDVDCDGLVRGFAGDVVSALDEWKLRVLVPGMGDAGEIEELEGLKELRGLNVRPGNGQESGRVRPRIEEIE